MLRVRRLNIRHLRASIGALLSLGLLAVAHPTAAEETSPDPSDDPKAGISMLVFPGDLSDPSGRNRLTELDFVLAAGQVADRTLRIRGSRDGNSLISLQVLDARIVNDKLELVNRLSPMSAWTSFSNNNFVLAPGEIGEVNISVAAPPDAGNSLNYSFVVARSELVDAAPLESETGATIAASAQYAMSMMTISGDPEFVRVQFEITDVGPILAGQQKYIRVFIDNQSQFAIDPSISVQLLSLDYSDLGFGPFVGQSPSIPRQSKLAIDIPIADDVLDGRYRILVEATEGVNTQRREFEKTLVFADENYSDFVFPWYEVILAALALGFVILLLLLVRSNRRARRALRGSNTAIEDSRAFIDSLGEAAPSSPDSPDQPPRQS